MTEVINGTCAGDLDDRIATAFAESVKSGVISELIAEAEGAAFAASEVSERARERALDPALAADAVTEARKQMDDAQFKRERLQTAVTRLHTRLKEVKAEEENKRRWAAYEKLKAERDKLAAELKAIYPGIEAKLGELIGKIDKSDREIDFLNAHALPTGAERLQNVELIARGIESWRVNSSQVVRITWELCLPAFKKNTTRTDHLHGHDRARPPCCVVAQ